MNGCTKWWCSANKKAKVNARKRIWKRAITYCITNDSIQIISFPRDIKCLLNVCDDVKHSITSIMQSFVNKCNTSNSCKLFYLDYKSMLFLKSPQKPYTAFTLDWQVWVQDNTVYSAYLFRDERWTLLGNGNQILNRRSGIISIHVTHTRLHKFIQVHVIVHARLVRCVLVRISPNWPSMNETAVNGRC